MAGGGIARYRFPGFDGLSLDYVLDIEHAAQQIANLANRYPAKPVRLLGYSTGGPIVILASQMMLSEDVRVAAMSSAVNKASGFPTAIRGVCDAFAASYDRVRA